MTPRAFCLMLGGRVRVQGLYPLSYVGMVVEAFEGDDDGDGLESQCVRVWS